MKQQEPQTFTETLRDPETGELLPANVVQERINKREQEAAQRKNDQPKKEVNNA